MHDKVRTVAKHTVRIYKKKRKADNEVKLKGFPKLSPIQQEAHWYFTYSNHPIHRAIEEKRSELIPFLVTLGTSVEFPLDSFTPLQYAILFDDVNAAEALLECGANIERMHKNMTVLPYAIQNTRSSIPRLLIKHGADLNASAYSKSLIQLAIESNNIDAIKALLEAKRSVNQQTERTLETPMHLAIRQPKVSPLMIEILLSFKPDLTITDKNGVRVWDALQSNVQARKAYEAYHALTLTKAAVALIAPESESQRLRLPPEVLIDILERVLPDYGESNPDVTGKQRVYRIIGSAQNIIDKRSHQNLSQTEAKQTEKPLSNIRI